MEKNCEEKISTDLYIAEIPTGKEVRRVENKERQDEIDRASCERVRLEKYYVWRLLEYAIKHHTGMSLEEACVYRGANGKWLSDKCHFSMTHSHGLMAVAISNAPVGIDIEPIGSKRPERFAERVLNSEELAEYTSTPEAERVALLFRKWTEKESLFKKKNASVFIPKEIDTTMGGVISYEFDFNDKVYFLSVASDNIEDIGLYPNIEID